MDSAIPLFLSVLSAWAQDDGPLCRSLNAAICPPTADDSDEFTDFRPICSENPSCEGNLRCHMNGVDGGCLGRACYVAITNRGNLRRGCIAADYPVYTEHMRVCVSSDWCNGGVLEGTSNVSINATVLPANFSLVNVSAWPTNDLVLTLLNTTKEDLDLWSLNVTLNETDSNWHIWQRHKTVSGIVLFLLICLIIFAIALILRYCWIKVLSDRWGGSEWAEGHCPDPSLFWKALGRHRTETGGGGSSERASAYYAHGLDDASRSVRFQGARP